MASAIEPGCDPTPDHPLAADFLEAFRPGGPWVLTAIRPDRKAIATRTVAKAEEVVAFCDRHSDHNLYFSVNPTLRPTEKKAEREDIAALSYLHVDIDPRVGEALEAERERALGLLTTNRPEGVPPPTFIIFSGGGYQAFWRLREPFRIDGDLERAEQAKLWNLQLELLFGADKCHNVDRIMRLPGTVNWPDARKRKKGRVPALAEWREYKEGEGSAYSIEEFQKAPAPSAGPGEGAAPVVDISGGVRRLGDVEELNRWGVSDRVKAIVAQGHLRDVEGPKEGDDSRSAWLMDACCQMVRCRVPDDVMYAVITDPDFGVSESVLDKGSRADAYARRQIGRAKEMADDSFALDPKGEKPIAKSQHNIRVAMRRLGVRVSHNEFSGRSLIEGLEGFSELTDAALIRLRLTIAREFGFEPPKDWFTDVVLDTALANRFHPVCEYLDGLDWDKKPRVHRWLAEYMGAHDTEYTRAVGRLLLVAAVRRVRKPGCKFDEMLVLQSPQGMLKSSALRVLAVRDEWFSDDLPLGVEGKIVVERTSGKWIVEAAELKGMRRAKVEQLKAFLSRQFERARLAYARLESDHPRHFVLVGTTNDERYLQDRTGNRRFWPVTVGQVDLEALRRDRDQLWAEAAHLEAQGASIRLDPELWEAAGREQADREVIDPWETRLADALGDEAGKILAEDVWAIVDRPSGQRTQADNERLGACMRKLGWEHRRLRIEGRPRWCYAKGTTEQRERQVVLGQAPSDEELPF